MNELIKWSKKHMALHGLGYGNLFERMINGCWKATVEQIDSDIKKNYEKIDRLVELKTKIEKSEEFKNEQK